VRQFQHTRSGAPAKRGTATTETVLVIPVLLILVSVTPWVAHLFLDLLVARGEAHRDVFDKTTSMVLMPDSLMNNHVNGAMSTQFGTLTTETRKHAFATFPPDVPASVNGIFDPPVAVNIPVGPFTLDLFGDGFPNYPVEGWEYIEHEPGFSEDSTVQLMTYGGVIRSPWTWLGWPWIATQDLMVEPKKLQDWQAEQEHIDDTIRERYKLAE
jgi:hypothetical protein